MLIIGTALRIAIFARREEIRRAFATGRGKITMRARMDLEEMSTGRLQIGEGSVAIAVSSPHRKEGIEACHYAIDRLKQIVPVWKKEVWTDGEHWIEGSLTPHDEASPAPDSVEAG